MKHWILFPKTTPNANENGSYESGRAGWGDEIVEYVLCVTEKQDQGKKNTPTALVAYCNMRTMSCAKSEDKLPLLKAKTHGNK